MEKYYHFTEYKCLESIYECGLIPSNGKRSMSVNDYKKVVYLSKGVIPTILMFFAIKGLYESYKGSLGSDLLDKSDSFIEFYNTNSENYSKYGKISPKFQRLRKKYGTEKLKKEYELALLVKNQVENIRKFSSFEDYWGNGVYLSVTNIENIKCYNNDPHNCWVENSISPDKIRLVILKNKTTGKIKIEKMDIINYLMATTTFTDLYDEFKHSIGKNEYRDDFIASIRVFKNYYDYNKENFDSLKREYDLLEVPLCEIFKKEKNTDYSKLRNHKKTTLTS